MLATQIEVSDGTLNIINVGIEFFEQNDISVSLDQSEPLVLGLNYQWSAATTIQFLDSLEVPGGLVPNGVSVLIRRGTESDAIFNIYDGGAPFSRLTLDENFEQLLFLAQEYKEGLGIDGLKSNLNMNGFRILNVGDPTNSGDAVNKNYVDVSLSKTVRGTEVIAPMPPAGTRAGRLLSFDNGGNPIAVFPASAPVGDASSVTWSRLPLLNAIATVHQALDGGPVNIWENAYASLVVVRPNPADPSTWDWTPALNAACAANAMVVIPSPIGINGATTLSGFVMFTGTGKIVATASASLILNDPLVSAPLRTVFQITPQYTLASVTNTTTQARRISNISGTIGNEFVEPEWFGAVPFVSGAPVDSYGALDIAGRLGNVHLNSQYLISRAYLLQNKRRYSGTPGRPSDCGFVAAPELVAFTGNQVVYNYEQAGVSDFSAANGENQNPYVYLDNFAIFSIGLQRTGTTDNVDAFRQVDLFMWETTTIDRVSLYVRRGTVVATPTMYQLFRFQNGPTQIKNMDIIGVEDGVNIDCLADSAIEYSKMTNVEVRSINVNMNCNRGVKAVALKECPSIISNINIERHPSRFGGNAATRPSIIAQGPVRIMDVKLSTEAAGSLGVRILKRPDVAWEAMPVLMNIAMQPKPNDVVGYFSRLIEVYDTVAAATLELIDATYALSGVAQTLTSISGVAYFDGARLELYGASSALANHKNSRRDFTRNFGTVAAAGSVTIPVPRAISTGNFANIQYKLTVTGRGTGNLSAMHFGYLEGTGVGTSTLRNNVLVGGAVFTLAGSLSGGVGSLVVTNATAGNIQDVTVLVEFIGTPTPN